MIGNSQSVMNHSTMLTWWFELRRHHSLGNKYAMEWASDAVKLLDLMVKMPSSEKINV